MKTTPKHQACVYCGRPLDRHERSQAFCKAESCEREDTRRTRAALREQFLANARQVRLEQAGRIGESDPESYTVVSIPRSKVRMRRLPAKRRWQFADRLRAIIDSAFAARVGAQSSNIDFADFTPEAPMEPALRDMLFAACGECRGMCCTNGDAHAYINTKTIHRYLSQHPDADKSSIADTYLSYIGRRTYEDACVYQGRHGCTLPREMRADICNSFFCEGLREFRDNLDSTKPLKAFMIHNDSTSGSAFFDITDLKVRRRR
jgi:hypothetical protein